MSIGFTKNSLSIVCFVGIGCHPVPYITHVVGEVDRSDIRKEFCRDVNETPVDLSNTFLFSGVGPYLIHLILLFDFFNSYSQLVFGCWKNLHILWPVPFIHFPKGFFKRSVPLKYRESCRNFFSLDPSFLKNVSLLGPFQNRIEGLVSFPL